MDENTNTEHDKYELAVQISVLSYDLNVANPTVPTLLKENTEDQLIAKRDSLLAMIDEQVSLDGFYEVPAHMDATWLCTLLQTELGAYVDVDPEAEQGKCIVLVDPS
ncbi:hypothetical protein SEA_LIZZ_95 [Streptomyces phage Lizz]|nr:hypothetical protein SEA_PHTOWN_95 [Streptomyces phage PHTowN]QNO12912.1 hypothetical protein SEA_SHAKENBAKE_95 [Streptomyces phage ShakeNBake]QYW07642.1 hypothetical protein SEA_LIZZ_95 [Streptomyces phage Lizz]